VPTAGLEQSFDHGSLYALRAAVAAHAAAAGLPRLRVYDVVSAAHELAANAVRHGAGRGLLRLWVEGQYLRCEISDDGPAAGGAAAAGAGNADPNATWSTSHGHGLWLVDQIADQVSLDHGPGGTTATITFVIGSADISLKPEYRSGHRRRGEDGQVVFKPAVRRPDQRGLSPHGDRVGIVGQQADDRGQFGRGGYQQGQPGGGH
jgi:anti-sigma regulatory factor (Ser/Thr protein kinase)